MAEKEPKMSQSAQSFDQTIGRSNGRSSGRLSGARRLGWYLAAACILLGSIHVLLILRQATGPFTMMDWIDTLGLRLIIPATFSILAALILQRQPDNRVGWLMMVVALGTVNPTPLLIEHFYPAPEAITPGLWLLVWLDGWSWIPFIFPIFLIPLHFPTGRPPSPRWNWVNYLAIGMWLFFIIFVSFLDEFGPLNGDWVLPNPIGFLPLSTWSNLMGSIWTIGLLTMVMASVVSLFVRYRSSQNRERQQIKWLLYAGAMFAIFYSITAIWVNLDDSNTSVWFNLGLVLSVLAIPAAIAIAILRYRLYDIDLLIRRTLQYTLVTGLLALVYFGGITILQAIFTSLSGQQSSLAIALSTLAIAALFNPVRKRVQEFIDRRFYRKKYDAEQALAEFAAAARNETDMTNLTEHLTSTVLETVNPQQVSLWIKK
jgi:hypothetical protein